MRARRAQLEVRNSSVVYLLLTALDDKAFHFSILIVEHFLYFNERFIYLSAYLPTYLSTYLPTVGKDQKIL